MAVDDTGRWAGFAAFQLPRRNSEVKADRFDQVAITQVIEVALDGRSGRKILGHHPPLAAAIGCIENRVEHLAHVRRSRPPDRLRRLHEGSHQFPFPVVEVACITHRRSAFSWRAVSVLGMCRSVRCGNRTESHPAEIAHSF